MSIDIPQPYLVGAFGIILGAIVTSVVTRRRANRQVVDAAMELSGDGVRRSLEMSQAIVGVNSTLLKANEAFKAAVSGLEEQIKILSRQFEDYKRDASIERDSLAAKVEHLEEIIAFSDTVRDIKSRRVAAANENKPLVKGV
jgi:hypothetical protein